MAADRKQDTDLCYVFFKINVCYDFEEMQVRKREGTTPGLKTDQHINLGVGIIENVLILVQIPQLLYQFLNDKTP